MRMYLTAKSRSRFRQHDTFVFRGRTPRETMCGAGVAGGHLTMNPTVPDTFITHSYTADAVVAVEDGAAFRRDIRCS